MPFLGRNTNALSSRPREGAGRESAASICVSSRPCSDFTHVPDVAMADATSDAPEIEAETVGRMSVALAAAKGALEEIKKKAPRPI